MGCVSQMLTGQRMRDMIDRTWEIGQRVFHPNIRLGSWGTIIEFRMGWSGRMETIIAVSYYGSCICHAEDFR